MYHFTDGGLRNVWLRNGYIEHQTPYGHGVSFHDLDGLIIAICQALHQKPGKLSGAEFRYIRTAMQFSQKSLGKLFGYTEQAVAKWEKYGKVPKVVDAALRLVFIEKHDGNRATTTAIDMLNAIDRITATKITLTKEKSAWSFIIEIEDSALGTATVHAAAPKALHPQAGQVHNQEAADA